MGDLLSGEPSHHGVSQEQPEESGENWYLSRKEIEENSPSRRDGIDLKKETYLRKSYCTFLQDLGMRLKVPQVTIATAIIFCHRFFLRQSHAKNDRRTIATVCMFLAGKVEETPRPLKDVILVSYEIIHKKDAAALQRIKQKEVYEQQKELILQGERIVLATLGFDFNLHHPYKPLVEAIKKFQVAQNALAQVAWNFVNDGLRTSLCLQFKPHHIAAGAIFLAAKFLKVKLPSEGDHIWWQEFDVAPRQLEDVSNQMLELYEQNRVPPSQASEADDSAGASQRPPSKAPPSDEHGGITSNSAQTRPPVLDQPDADNRKTTTQTQNSESERNDVDNNIINPKNKEQQEPTPCDNFGDDDQEGNNSRRIETRDPPEFKDKHHKGGNNRVAQSPQNATKKLDKEKIKAAIEQRKKSRGEIPHKVDTMDELERELEDVELPSEKREIRNKQNNWSNSKPLNHDNSNHGAKYSNDFDTVEEGEVESFDDGERRYRSPKSNVRKRKAGSSPLDEYGSGSQYPDDRNGSRRVGYPENNEHKRHVQQNHV